MSELKDAISKNSEVSFSEKTKAVCDNILTSFNLYDTRRCDPLERIIPESTNRNRADDHLDSREIYTAQISRKKYDCLPNAAYDTACLEVLSNNYSNIYDTVGDGRPKLGFNREQIKAITDIAERNAKPNALEDYKVNASRLSIMGLMAGSSALTWFKYPAVEGALLKMTPHLEKAAPQLARAIPKISKLCGREFMFCALGAASVAIGLKLGESAGKRHYTNDQDFLNSIKADIENAYRLKPPASLSDIHYSVRNKNR